MARRAFVVAMACVASLLLGYLAYARFAPPSHVRTYSSGGVSFSYPAWWHIYPNPWSSSFRIGLAYVSNVPMHEPCLGETYVSDCGEPLLSLPADSVELLWTLGASPGRTVNQAQGANMRLDDRPARLQMLSPVSGWCPINTRADLDVIIAQPGAKALWYELEACMSGPHIRRVKAEVMAVLRSFHAPHTPS